jgi:hypothetical protein
MICKPCQKAAEMNQQSRIKEAKHNHGGCWGCECQHKTGQGWFARKGEKVSLHQTQSP